MKRQLLIDVGLYETRAAVLENGSLTDLSFFRSDSSSNVGEIHLGRISAFAKGLDAAFVDLGPAGNGFILARDIPFLDKTAPISKRLIEGQKILCQIIKSPKGDKGCQLSAFPKFNSQNLIYNPFSNGLIFSKNIKAAAFKDQVMETVAPILDEVGGGMTVRSSANNVLPSQLALEASALTKNWTTFQQAAEKNAKPRRLSIIAPLVIDARNKYATATTDIIVNDQPSYSLLNKGKADFVHEEASLVLWTDTELLFDAYQIEEQIEDALEKYVPLPSGGNIVIEQTEALIAIDVNSGSLSDNRHNTNVAWTTNREAASAIARQIRLRNLSGIIIVDFIQMSKKSAVRKLTELLREQTQSDPVHVITVGMTELGLMQITRQRKEACLDDLLLVTTESDGVSVPINTVGILLRQIKRNSVAQKSPNITLHAGKNLLRFLIKQKAEIEKQLSVNIFLQENASFGKNEYRLS